MFERNLAYEASAGSGKTFMLVVRYLSLLFSGADPAKILTLTFTNKAAKEMQERIGATLEDLQNKNELLVIAQTLEVDEAQLLRQKETVYRRYLKAPTKIMTIDSFFAKILRKFSLYVGLMSDFTTLSKQHETLLLERFLNEVEVARSQKELISLLIESKKRMGNIFALLDQFYIKSKELAHIRFEDADPSIYENEALKIVAQMKALIDRCEKASKDAKNAFVIEDIASLMKKTWLGRDTLHYRTFSKCYTPELDDLFFKLKSILNDYFCAKEQRFFYVLSNLALIYQKAKRALYKAKNEVGFDDVAMLVYEILHERIDNEFLYFRLDAKIDHILLDEFQDTSILQYEILHPLIQEALSGKGVSEGGSFFFVGDTKQSIYRFRGGVSSLFKAVAKIDGTRIEKLTTNYRSKEEIVNFVNDTFRDKIEGYADQKTRDDATGGYVEVGKSEDTLKDCYEHIKTLQSLGVKASDIAVLCFTNDDGESIKEFLEQKELPVVTETTLKLIHQKSVRALIECLKYLYFQAEIFKENFFALLGREVEMQQVDFTQKSPLVIAKEAIERYGIFEDNNILSFLEIISSYETIEELLFEYERIEAEVIGREKLGIRILTIHKSKGLEFKHLIVVDRLKKPPSDRSVIIYDYEGIELKDIFLRISKRDAVDKRYATALERAKKLAHVDSLNALYVAFTRAKESLFIVQKAKQSAFEILGLQEQKRGALRREAAKEETPQKSQNSKAFKEIYYGSQSELLESQKKLEEDQEAIRFGSATHLFLEMMERFEASAIKPAKEIVRNRYGAVLSQSRIDEIEKRVQNLLQNERFQTLIQGECFKERALRFNKALFYIDLLVKSENGYVIIDYKTGKNFHDEYVKQVQNYKNAVFAITNEPVEGYLCYLLEDGLEIVDV